MTLSISHVREIALGTIPTNDKDVLTGSGPTLKNVALVAYLARPFKAGKYRSIIVVHETRGLNNHIRDVARRFAKQSYVVSAPDFLSRKGCTAEVYSNGEAFQTSAKWRQRECVSEDIATGFCLP